ncbi:MAG: phospholipid carrier-dependent glycosyltransferase [Clostridia bacterium]|nr:phospholipid carrier-dependent glycosyltransferase [Clostridia bacterium]
MKLLHGHFSRIHRVSVLFVALWGLLLALLGAAGAENLLENGSFEILDSEGMPAGWQADAYVLDEGYTVFSVSQEDAVEGSLAAAIRNIGENDARFSQKVSVEPESLYRFSGYVRTEGVEDGRGANLSIEGLYAFSEGIFDTSDGWQYIEWYGETGEDQTSVTLYARLGGYSGESRGKAWFDDLRLEQVNVVPGDGIADRWYQPQSVSYYAEEEISQESAASPAWPRLIMLALAYTLAAILLAQWLRKKQTKTTVQASKTYRGLFYVGLAFSFLLRLVISFFVLGYMVDVNCFTSWGGTMAAYGPVGFYPETSFCDYPPAYTYILGLNALICQWIPGISNGMVRVVYRFFPALCDVLSCVVLDRFLARKKPEISNLTRRVYLLLLAFHPVTILNSAAWGQMDSTLTLLILLVAIYAIEGKWELCLPCYMLSALVKPQSLMLGFLGLAAMILIWVREKTARKRMVRGIIAAIAVLLVVVIPFSLRQDPFWLIDQYAGTLASYPYATVNTANFYYLLKGNWNAIGNKAPLAASLLLAASAALYGVCYFLLCRKRWKYTWVELSLSLAECGWFLFCAFSGGSWGQVGTGAMVFAFLVVLSLYLRKGEIRFLPYLGGLLFLMLYVFGVKMHERYLFPAFLLFALALGLQRDRRILVILLTVTCTMFVNEGVVLDNSIRLGSSLGHLNQDTYVLAMILSAINCLVTLYAVWVGLDLARSPAEAPERQLVRWMRDAMPQDNRLHWRRWDTAALCGILVVYSLISFSTLGSRKAPQTSWTSSEYTENVVLDLGEHRDNFAMLYFARVSRYDFSVAVSEDGQSWADETWAQMDQGQCWKWKYVTDSTQQGDGTRSYGNNRHWFSGRYVRITAHQINLALCEVLFRDAEGRILPVSLVDRREGDLESSLYSDPSALIDEQDTFEAIPIYFSAEALEAEGEENPAVAQPSWWNSTYFDEIYHARTAWEFLQGSAPYETSHPPLGKVLMSWGVALFGMTPFGWRFAGAVAGVAMLALIYLIAKQMTKSTAVAAFACGLFALDCMHLTQTQIATIDSFPVLFILMAFFFMLRFLQTDWTVEKRGRVLTDLGLSGLGMGLSIASKWIGIYAGAGLAVLYFWHGFRVLRAHGEGNAKAKETVKPPLRVFLQLCLWCLLFFVAVPAVIYVISYLPYFAYRHFTNIGDYLHALIQSQQGMFNYHSTPGLGMDHPFYSPWYEWPVMGKPMFYSTKQYIFNNELSFSIFAFGNPVIWWGGIPALVLCCWCWIRNRNEIISLQPQSVLAPASLDTNLVFLLIGFLAQYLPWTLVPRGTYIYHYFASVPFLILALTLLMDQLRLRDRKTGHICMIALTLLAFGAMTLLFPYVSGIMAPVSWLDLGKGLLKIWY